MRQRHITGIRDGYLESTELQKRDIAAVEKGAQPFLFGGTPLLMFNAPSSGIFLHTSLATTRKTVFVCTSGGEGFLGQVLFARQAKFVVDGQIESLPRSPYP